MDKGGEAHWLPPELAPKLGMFLAKFVSENGVDAFGAIWSQLPLLRRFAWLFRFPVSRHFALIFYSLFLAWQRMDRTRRQRRAIN